MVRFPRGLLTTPSCHSGGVVDKQGFILSLLLCRPTRLSTSRLLPCPLPTQVGYVSILNLPMRRAEAKRKLEHTTTAFAQVG